MPTPREDHRKAMSLLGMAEMSLRDGQFKEGNDLLSESLQLEERAAQAYADRFDVEPTRSQLCKGAAILALRVRDWRRAEKWISTALIGSPPEAIAEQLRDLLEDVYFHRHLLEEDVHLSDDEFELTFVGKGVGHGIVQKSEMFRRVEVLESFLIRIAERQDNLPYRTSGRASSAIRSKSEIFIGARRAASFGVTLRVGSEQRALPTIGPAQSIIDEALDVLQVLDERPEADSLKEIVPQEDYRKSYVALAKELAPDGRKISQIILTSDRKGYRKTVNVHRQLISKGVTLLKTELVSLNEILTIVGEVRVLQSSKSQKSEYFTIEPPDSPGVRIYAEPQIMADIIPLYFKSEAIVKYKVEQGKNVFVDIERSDDE